MDILVKARHRRDQCMECSSVPVIEIRWAEGMAHAWFCKEHYEKFKKEHPDEIDYEKEIEHGIARSDFRDRKSPLSLDFKETERKSTPTVSDVHRPASMGEQEAHMPYSVNDDSLPEAVKRLPESKKKIWVAAFNAALEQYKDESKAFATAWAAIKKAFDEEDLEKAGRRHSKMDMDMFDEIMGAMNKVVSMMRELQGGEDEEGEQEDEQMKGSREEAREDQRRRAAKYGIQPKPNGNITKPSEWANVPDSDWGDPVNYRYPLPDEKQEMAAMRYFDQGDQQSGGGYNDREWAIIGRRIAQHLGSDYEYRDGKIVNVSQKGEKITLTAALFKADEQRQLCYGVVLKPAPFVDTQGDVISKEEIEEAAHRFMEESRLYDLFHKEDLDSRAAVPVESYVTPQDVQWGDKVIPAGSWVVVTHIKDAAVWEKVKKGEVNAYSIRGIGYRKRVPD